MTNKKALIEQSLLLPVSLLIGYVFASLRKRNEVSLSYSDGYFYEILWLSIVFTFAFYIIVSCIFRTKIHDIVKEIFVFKTRNCKTDITYIICGTFIFFIFYMLALKTPCDYELHTKWAIEVFDWRSLKKSISILPYPMWHVEVSLLNKVFYIPPVYAAAIVSAWFYTFEYCIIRNLILICNTNVDGMKPHIGSILACCSMFIQPIHIPWFNQYQYLGQGTPNVWHNPTLASCYPFALICTYLFASILKKYYNHEEIKPLEYVRSGIFLFLSVIAKPAFFQIFVPAVAVIFLVVLIRTKGKSFLFSAKYVLSCLPAGLWCIFIFIQSFIGPNSPDGSGIGIGFLEVWNLWTPNVLISFLIATSFPLLYFILRKRCISNKFMLSISSLCLISGVLEYCFLKETGPRLKSGNFGWGYACGLTLIFTWAIIDFVPCILNSRKMNKMAILIVVYVLNFLFGIRYYIEMFNQQIRL